MKVLMMVSWYSPRNQDMFAGIFHYEQSIALKKYCDMALYFPFDETENELLVQDYENNLLTFRTGKSNGRIKRAINIYKSFKIINKKYKPDIIHAHVALGVGFYAVLLGKLFNVPVILTEHNPIELMGFEKLKSRILAKFVYHYTNKNICVSTDSREKLNKYFPKEKFDVVYNGIIDPKKIDFENKLYAKDKYVNCAIVAGFYSKEIKGYQFLLPAMKKLKEEGYKIFLHICGGGDFFDYYRNMAFELGIDDICIFYGHCTRTKVYTIVNQMDFCISASIYECSGVSVQEAMLLGKPLVVTKSGGANSLVNNQTAIVVDKESIDAIYGGCKEMIQSLEKFDNDIIQQYAYNNFEIDNVSKKYFDIYTKMKIDKY